MLAAGARWAAVADLAAMFRYYDDHGLPGNSLVLAMLLGRAPTELGTVLARDLPPAP